jgi:hypothetical protein
MDKKNRENNQTRIHSTQVPNEVDADNIQMEPNDIDHEALFQDEIESDQQP